MRILLVEDDENKRLQITSFLRERYSSIMASDELICRASYRSGLKACIDENFDLLLLDMTMSTFDHSATEAGGRPRHFAGRDILRELKRRKRLLPTIVCTGFDVIGEGTERRTLAALTDELHDQFKGVFLGTVYYTPSERSWRVDLETILNQFLKGRLGANTNS